MTSLLVILCSHNPRPDFLGATLDALRRQSLHPSAWDFLIVDNASSTPVEAKVDISWHPHARVVQEPALGPARARHRALTEARNLEADLILFVDDDNVLAPDYLVRGLEVSLAWPQLGAWGGQLLPRFECPPAPWMERYFNLLAVMPLAADRWTNHFSSYDAMPPTAGCFVRGAVWRRYLELVEQEPLHLTLSRGEDMDLALSAIDLGLGVGRLRVLRLEHLIPAARLTPAYVEGLVEGTVFGTDLLEYIRFRRLPKKNARGWVDRALLAWRTWRLPEPARTFRRAELRGRARAQHTIGRWLAEKYAAGRPASATS